MNPIIKALRNMMEGAYQKGEYWKRQPAIKSAYADNEKISEQEYRIQSELEMNTKNVNGQPVPYDNPPTEYDYPGGWENPMAGIDVGGNQDSKYDFSNVLRGSNRSGSNILDATVVDGRGRDARRSAYTRVNTETPYGTLSKSQLSQPGEDVQLYQNYPEGFGDLPAQEGTYSAKRLGPFKYHSAEAPEDMSFMDLLRRRFSSQQGKEMSKYQKMDAFNAMQNQNRT